MLIGQCPHDLSSTFTGQNYEHRRQHVEDKALFLGQAFCIDLCAYAAMSNHYHVVFHVNIAEAHALTDKQICERWHSLYKGTLLTQKYDKAAILDEAQWLALKIKLNQ